MSKDEEFERGMAAVRTLYGDQWNRELGAVRDWADDVQYDCDGGGDEYELDNSSICFRKDGAEYWFLVGDGQWDADDPRSEVIEALLAERDKDTAAMLVARTTLDAADARLREVMAERDAADREADRWRHGVPIEGDFICPDSLALTATRFIAEDIEAARDAIAVDRERLRERLVQVTAALLEMSAARDEACRILDGCIRDLAEHEDDASMMDGHRQIVMRLRAVGGE